MGVCVLLSLVFFSKEKEKEKEKEKKEMKMDEVGLVEPK